MFFFLSLDLVEKLSQRLFWTKKWSEIANLLILGCLSSGTSYVLNMVFGDEGIKIDGGKK